MFQIALLYRLLFVKLAFNPTHIANANKKYLYNILKRNDQYILWTFYLGMCYIIKLSIKTFDCVYFVWMRQ